jgi:hypothetical protein
VNARPSVRCGRRLPCPGFRFARCRRRPGALPNDEFDVFAVTVLAPYLLTTLIDRPGRLIYQSGHWGCR